MTLRFKIYCKTPFCWFYFFYLLQLVCINLTEVPLWIYHAPVQLAIKCFYSQKTQTLAQTTFFCFLMTLYLIFLPIIQPHYSLSLQPVLIRNTSCNEKSLWARILTTHRCPVSVCVFVCVCVRRYKSLYEGADIFKAAGHLWAGVVLLLFPSRAHNCFLCKSLSAEFLMNCTKASLLCLHSCMRAHKHKQTQANFLFVHNRNGFGKEWMRLSCTQKGNIMHK